MQSILVVSMTGFPSECICSILSLKRLIAIGKRHADFNTESPYCFYLPRAILQVMIPL